MHFPPKASAQQKNFVVVSHKYVSGPDDDLVLYLNSLKSSNVLHIRHSFSTVKDRRSSYTWYKKGEVFKEYRSADYRKLGEPLLYLKELYFTFFWVMQTDLRFDKYVGMDGLCALFGNLLSLSGRIKTTVFWAIDFVPSERFSGILRNKIYHWINLLGYKKSDEMWDLGPRMAQAREESMGFKIADYKLHRVVPYGVWVDRIKKYSYQECQQTTLVYMGHIGEKSGIQLVIKALPQILKVMPNFRFKIIGGGPYVENLIKLAKETEVSAFCDFLGKIDSIRTVEDEIAKSALSIAPYIKTLDTFTKYADPGKVKTYLACGVPVLLTDVPWNAREIEAEKCGKVISEDTRDIVCKVLDLMDATKNQKYRSNALSYSQRFNYKTIFSFLGNDAAQVC